MRLILLVGDAHAQSIGVLVRHREGQAGVVGPVSGTIADDLERAVHAGAVASDVRGREAIPLAGGDVACVVDGRGDGDDGRSFGILTLEQLVLA